MRIHAVGAGREIERGAPTETDHIRATCPVATAQWLITVRSFALPYEVRRARDPAASRAWHKAACRKRYRFDTRGFRPTTFTLVAYTWQVCNLADITK